MDLLSISTTLFPGVYNSLFYVLTFLFLAYCIADAISTRQLVRKQAEYPLVGSPFTFVPKFILNLVYAWKATDLAQEGYEKVRLNPHSLDSLSLLRPRETQP